MKLVQMVVAEVRFRRVAFVLGCFSIAVATGTITGSLAMLRGHDLRSERLVEEKEAATRAAMARMEDDYRVIMKRMGYNVMVLPVEQDLAELHKSGWVTATMPYSYAERLAEAGVMSLNHLLPVLQREVEWEERGESVLLCGVRGQMALAGRRGRRAPIQAPIPEGRVALGSALAQRIGVSAGEEVVFKGERFVVERVDPARGSIEDMALWVGLERVQEWLGLPGLISGILALECVCHSDSVGEIIAAVREVLPDVQVFEFTSKVQGRAEARKRAAETSREAIAAEQAQRLVLRGERVRLATMFSGLAVAGGGLWVLLLAYGNAADRRSEIGMLRAVGLRQADVVGLLLGKAVLLGLIGGGVGVLVGVVSGVMLGGVPLVSSEAVGVAGGWSLVVIWGFGPLLAGVAALGPAVAASQCDPADVLGKE